ncbi:Hsp20/alpha crystallin family protein [Aspergillus aculeatinus CBS 121060]|uniref:30 kd HEAT shock protein n=1 Tax=Aspergillus aculeatinus CBS 121060 TaxID=1448322 RepID=A0ACD1H8W3_9EURO|nr:30 kd HEAT shock protein [Aspergillus aculeatinus CBS 121060]RAH70022.1 30 kd HEAT shock protein [Aspergillus aculeatinus CBS 121060]
MSLFRSIPSAGEFGPLFRLLDDYDLHRSGQGASSSTTAAARSFAPRFDVRETAEGYHLDGELPGIAQKDVDIEFSDPQTLVIKGRTEREYHNFDESEEGQQGQQGQQETATQENKDTEKATESTEVSKTGDKQVGKNHKNKPHFWVSERSIGEFHRTFSFPTRVDQDSVKASLKNGILSIFVPKAAKPTSKKITIE